jgi:ABC-2 type transport system permease protein
LNFNKIFQVAKWEFLEKIKTKAFIISLILTPAIIIGFTVVPTLLSNQEQKSPEVIGLFDPSGIYFHQLDKELTKYRLVNGQPNYILINLLGNLNGQPSNIITAKDSADKDVLTGKVEGYLLVKDGGTDSVNLEYRSKSVGNFTDVQKLEDAFNNVRIERKLNAENVNPAIMNYISNKIQIKPIKIEESGKESKADFLSTFFSSFIFVLLLFMMIIYSGQMLVRSLVEEKSSRLIEILISSCKPEELLAGKIAGLSALGLFQIIIWGLIAIALLGASLIPTNIFQNIGLMIVYFVLGFIFYTALFVGIGSISTTEQEAQQITSYISMVLILPIVLLTAAIQNPHSLLMKVLTYIPLTLPTTMLIRLNLSELPAAVIITTILIMIASIAILVKVTSKIFRIGILSYGKRPSMKELKQWIKEK